MKPRTALYLLLPFSLALAVAATGCAVTPYGYYSARVYTEAPPVEFGYTPMLYEGYVVYYNDASLPFYWVNGVQFDVPVAYREVYVEDYHRHHDAYAQWDIQRGEQYRGQHYDRKDHDGAQGHEDNRQSKPREDGEHQAAPAQHERERQVAPVQQERERQVTPVPQERERQAAPAQQERERPQPQVQPERERQPVPAQQEDPRKKREKDNKKKKPAAH